MLGEVLDTYQNKKLKVEIIDSYVYPNYAIYIKNSLSEQGCLHEELTAKELYERIINKLNY